MHVDTACGSSFCALNEAFRALRNGLCDQAIVTGSNTVFQPIFSYEMLDLHMISKDGKSKCMDSSANGYARAEAVVVILLQKKSFAKRIYATILNAKTNADGWKPEGVTFPGQEGQAKLLRETYSEIGLNPLDFSYIEAHTTGTTAGDPVELNAIHDVLCKDRKDSLLVGCIKSCIGHSEGASGLCALIKSLLVLQNKRIPPNLHLKNPNLAIKGLVDGRMTPVTKVTPFNGNIIPVNCFGFGGANVHVVIKSCDRQLTAESFKLVDSFPRLVQFCGRTESSIDYVFDHLIKNEGSVSREFLSLINDFSKTTLQAGMPYRSYMLIDGGAKGHVLSYSRQKPQLIPNRKVCLYFSSCAASHHLNAKSSNTTVSFAENLMGIPIFANSMQQMDNTIKVVGINLFECLQTKKSVSWSRKETIAVHVAIQIACIDLLKALKLKVDCLVGSSIGELAAAYYDGCVTAEQALLASFCAALFADDEDKLAASLNKILVNPTKRSKKWISSGDELASGSFFAERIARNLDSIGNVSPTSSSSPLSQTETTTIVEVGPWGLRQRTTSHSNNLTSSLTAADASSDGCSATLHCIGQLYMLGLNPAIENIYPAIEYPIPTCVPSLSSLIKWDHTRTWSLGTRLIELDKNNNAVLARIIPFHFDKQEHPEDNFLFDHKIDGRILFPATGYLAMAWFALAKLRSVAFSECPIKFTEVAIERATVMMPSKPTSFMVRMNEDTGVFEVRDGDTVVVSGRMQLGPEEINNVIERKANDMNSSTTLLNSIDIYKELRVRGYDYDSFFQGMYSALSDGSESTIVWRDALPKNMRDTMSIVTDDEHDLLWLRSWIMFVDSVIQLTLMDENNTGRALLVPTKLQSLECSPRSFRAALAASPEINDPLTLSQSKLVTCVYNRHDDVIQTRGLVLRGLKTTLLKRTQQLVHAKKFEYTPFNELSTLFDDDKQRTLIERYYDECVRFAKSIAEVANRNGADLTTPKTTLDLNDDKHCLLRLLASKLEQHTHHDTTSNNQANAGNASINLDRDLLVGQCEDELYFQDRLLKPFFDLVTCNVISSPKHSILDVLEVTTTAADFNLCKKLTNLMDESLFSDQTNINYNLLCTKSNESSSSSTPSGVQSVVNYKLGNEGLIPNSHLIVCKALNNDDVCKQQSLLPALFDATKEGGFLMLITRDRIACEHINTALECLDHYQVLRQHQASPVKDTLYHAANQTGYKLIGSKTLLNNILPLNVSLFRKQRLDLSPDKQVLIEVGLANYDDWLEQLKTLLKETNHDEQRIWLTPKLNEPIVDKRVSGKLIVFVMALFCYS